MKIRTLLLLIALVLVAVFVAFNWSAITTPTTLSLGVASIQAPLGFVLLSLLVLFTALFLVFVVYSRASGFFKERHHTREMRAAQELAGNAESSRFTELRELIVTGLNRQEDLCTEATEAILSRLDRLDDAVDPATTKARATIESPARPFHFGKPKE